MQGLVIDDFFAISVEKADAPAEHSVSSQLHSKAQRAYDPEAILGSPAKDALAEDYAKVIGAEVDSRPTTRRRGMVKIGAPAQKRYGLSWISLNLAQLHHTSDALHLSLIGGWVSALTYRRPMLGLLNKCFALVKDEDYNPSDPKVIPLGRKHCDELVLLAVLAPLMVSNAGASIAKMIYSTDASLEMGAILKAPLDSRICTALFRSNRNKGGYTKLLSAVERLEVEEGLQEIPSSPQKPIALHYGFIEVFAGAAVVTKEMEKRGFLVATPIELTDSPEFNVAWSHVMAWLSFIIAEGRAESFMVEPVCTTFRIMRRPALRDRRFPLGYQPREEKTNMGNRLALRGLQCIYIGGRNYVPGIYEAPFSSKVRYLPSWKSLERKPDITQIRSDSCAFGSQHLKPFRFLGAHMEFRATDRRCKCKQEGRVHVRIQGQFTKKSATYVPDLAAALADDLASAVFRRRQASRDDGLSADGLEDQLVNEVMKSSNWELESKWPVRKSTHINLLEVEAVCKLASKLAFRGGDARAVVLVDSNVTKGATSKGRSSSLAISSYLRKLGATCISGGLYLSTPYIPTRLNAADGPTRGAEIRGPIQGLNLDSWETDDLYRLSEVSRLRRWASNWACLIIKLCGPDCLRWRDSFL